MKYFFKILFELVVALLLFFLLIKFTPVFDNFLEWNNTSVNNENISYNTGKQITQTIYYDKIGNPITEDEYLASFHNEADNYIQKISNFKKQPTPYQNNRKKSCTTPRWARIQNGTSIIAYIAPLSTSDNVCQSQTRVCNNGRLNGSYQYKYCEHEIDWFQWDIVAVQWAQESFQTFITPYVAPPMEYIQPTETTDRQKIYTNEGKLSPPSYNPSPKFVWNNKRKKTPFKNKDDWNKDNETIVSTPLNCTTPWKSTVAHGEFVYAYNVASTNHQQNQCVREKRACINGKLSGTFAYEACKYNEPVVYRQSL